MQLDATSAVPQLRQGAGIFAILGEGHESAKTLDYQKSHANRQRNLAAALLE